MLLSKANLGDSLKKTIKSKIINFNDFDIKIVAMNIKQQLEIETISRNKKDNNELILAMLKFCCVDENNEQLFETDDDVALIPSPIAVKIFEEAIILNGLAATDLELKAKN